MPADVIKFRFYITVGGLVQCVQDFHVSRLSFIPQSCSEVGSHLPLLPAPLEVPEGKFAKVLSTLYAICEVNPNSSLWISIDNRIIYGAKSTGEQTRAKSEGSSECEADTSFTWEGRAGRLEIQTH